MRKVFNRLMFSLFLVGLGSAIFFFEITDFTYDDGKNLEIAGSTTTLTNTYGLDGVDYIDASGAKIVIDDTQVGIKVELTYNDTVTQIQPRTYSIITDCTSESSTLCESTEKEKVTTLVLSYDHLESQFRPKELIDVVIDQAKHKTIINVFNLMIPKMTVTVSSENMKFIRQ